MNLETLYHLEADQAERLNKMKKPKQNELMERRNKEVVEQLNKQLIKRKK